VVQNIRKNWGVKKLSKKKKTLAACGSPYTAWGMRQRGEEVDRWIIKGEKVKKLKSRREV